MNSAPFSSGKSHDSPILCVSAVFAVIIMLSAAFVPAISEDSDAVSSDSWVCTITQNGTSLTTKYSVGGGELSDTTAIKGFDDERGNRTEGSWGYDEDGYGPFGSFYAAFDPDNSNEIVCHLNPYNLKEAVGGGTSVEVGGRVVDISGCNIMWCLPKIYISTCGSTITLASDDSYGGELAPAFTVGGVDYNYLALGVYEATSDGGKLGSVSGETPKNMLWLFNYRAQAKANGMVDGSIAQLWNFYQYQLYRLCSLAVMENFDSQGQAGRGDVRVGNLPNTGILDVGGPYQGTSWGNSVGVKLFIENVWGSLWEYVDDTVWWNDGGVGGLWAGQNVDPKFEHSKDKEYYTSDKELVYPYAFNGWGTSPSTDEDCWGLPTRASAVGSEYGTSTAPDYIYGGDTRRVLVVGGEYWYGGTDLRHDSQLDIKKYGDAAGLSCLGSAGEGGSSGRGTRLAFLFTIDPVADVSVKYVDDGAVLQSDLARKGHKYAISNSIPVKTDFAFVGWSDGTDVYHPGTSIIMGFEDITLTAVWGHTVTFDLKGGTWDRSDTVAAEEGTYTVPSAVPTKSGCTFKEWKCGDDSVLPGGTIELSSDVTLQAVWTSDSIPIIPIIPDDGDDPIEVVVDEKEGSGSGVDGESILLIAIIVVIIAELAVLAVSRKR